MPKYKPGDKVSLRKDLVYDQIYRMEDGDASDCVTHEMLKTAETLPFATIQGVATNGEYYLEEDNEYLWTDGMIEGLYTEATT